MEAQYGKRIRALRIDHGLKQTELAEKAGIAVNSLRRYESNERQPTIEVIEKIASALGMTVPAFFWDEAYNAGFDEGVKMEEWSNKQVDILLKDEGYTYSEREMYLIGAFSRLNDDGQSVAVERVEELTEIPKYQREETPPAPAEDATEGE